MVLNTQTVNFTKMVCVFVSDGRGGWRWRYGFFVQGAIFQRPLLDLYFHSQIRLHGVTLNEAQIHFTSLLFKAAFSPVLAARHTGLVQGKWLKQSADTKL
jgi:hypothetical protein